MTISSSPARNSSPLRTTRRRRRITLAGVVSAAVVVTSGAMVQGAVAAPQPEGASQHVIVLLRNQHTEAPATHADASRRVTSTDSDQSSLVKDARAHGGKSIRQLHVLNAFSVTASASEVAHLAANSAVAQVIPDRLVAMPTQDSAATAAAAAAASAAPASGAVPTSICPADPSKPQLEPEALGLTNTAFDDPSTPAEQLATGKGVKVAFLADGLDVNNPDFIRPDGSHVFIDYQDFSGDGPLAPTSGAEAFGDASSIAAQGRQVYDLAQFVSPTHPLPPGCDIRVEGMAPDASLVGLKVFPAGGFAFNSAILAALDYAVVVDKVDVINESFGSNQYPDTLDDPTALFNAQLVQGGITITASTGDAAGENTIGSPGSTPGVIAVGGTTSFRLYAQTTYNGFQLSNGKYADNNISGLSSSGVTQPGRTLDLVAPGDLGWALCSTNTAVFEGCIDNKGAPSPIQAFGGTSQSAPLVAGAAADVIQAYRDTHGGSTPTPAMVKQFLTGTAQDLGLPSTEQGAGLLDTRRAVEAARSAAGATAPAIGTNLITSPTQLDISAASGVRTTKTVKVTNVGSTPQTLHPALRSETKILKHDDFSVTLAPTTDPTFANQTGAARSFVEQKFTVPNGADRLAAAVSWPGAGQIVRFFLLDPDGTYTAYTIPQGVGNYGLADVRQPKAGTWTAVLVTTAGAAGFAGAVDFSTTSYRELPVGGVSPKTLTLAPGHSGTVSVRIPAGDAGDAADALQLDTPASGAGGVVPIVVRTLIATGANGGSYAGTFGGGNGRAGIPTPSRTYAFTVPSGRPDLAVSLKIKGNPNQAIYGFLVDPHGQAVNEQTNQIVASDGSVTFAPSLQFDHRSPQAGTWQFVFAVFGPIAGTATTTGYAGTVSYGLADVKATGVPNSASVKLKAGQPVTATVKVANHGAATGRYFADGRLNGRTTLTLAGQNASGYQLAPAPLNPFPAFQIPTETNSFTVNATSDRPINFEVSPFPADHVADLSFEGDPDVEASPAGLTPSVTVANPIVAPQTWLALPSQIGPFSGTAPTATVSFTATAHTSAFDPAVTSSTGDPLLASVQSSPPAATPLSITAGSSGSITVTITPTGAKGKVVKGVLYVDTWDPVTGSADEVAAVPYTYTIG